VVSAARRSQEQRVRALLEHVSDPEIPVLSVLDLGIVRSIVCAEDQVRIKITPTYSGCPAMEAIEDDIRSALAAAGFANVNIETVLSPAWTTDWLSEAGRGKLRGYGIAPPCVTRTAKSTIHCPRCGAAGTEQLSAFGSTACQALRRCRECGEPFGYLKAI
jgi:ring-1,2-phenylacetyl-CoA epoxidase subunit PaaD